MAPWRARINTAVAGVACYAITGVAGAVALAFAIAALFSWLEDLFGTVIASLIIAGIFLIIAVIPLILLAGVKRREEKRVELAAAKARSTQWISPATLSIGLQAMQMVGKNRGLAAAAVGSILVGWLASRMMAPAEDDATEPAE